MSILFKRIETKRIRPAIGDICEIQAGAVERLICRVVRLDAKGGLCGRFPMIYLFREVDIGRGVDSLPVSKMWDGPILLLDRALWNNGYCKRIATRPFGAGEKLECHCFRIDIAGEVSDEDGRAVEKTACVRFGPVGVYTVQGLERRVAERLGMSLPSEAR